MLPLTISIVTANNKKLIIDCLSSIYRNTEETPFEIYVVLNASADESETAIKAQFPEVSLIINRTKMGFTHNHNMVMRKSRGRQILVLNDDTLIIEGALDKMVKFMDDHSNVGILGCRILNPDGSLQWSCGKSFSHKFEFFKAGMLKPLLPFGRHRHFSGTQEVSWVTGACLLVRAEAAREVGLFDENIIIYFEDADWCYRMLQAGWKVMFYPEAKIIHYHGQTRKKHLARDTLIMYQSRYYFFSKHYSSLTFYLIRLLTMMEIGLRVIHTRLIPPDIPGNPDSQQELLRAYSQIIKNNLFLQPLTGRAHL